MSGREAASWLQHARADVDAVETLFRGKNYLPACFHAHQTVEKLLKGFLVSRDVLFPKTHDLSELLHACARLDPAFRAFADHASWLTGFYPPSRYPDDLAGTSGELRKEDARRARTAAKAFWAFVAPRLAA
jgi:HEPN domain-containing protein